MPTAPTAADRSYSLQQSAIRIRGARTHNLKNVDVDIPHNKLVVLTGLSGSGKSSLAFDTLLAEGQRQYVDSLSAYSRQFIDQMQRPDVDVVEGLPPGISIDQQPGSSNPRSTVATLTEIYDHLRVLMARTADIACPDCGAPISQQSPAEIQQAIAALPEQTKVMILAPMVRGRRGKHAAIMEKIRREGFVRVRIDGVPHDLDSAPELSAQKRHDIEAVVDRVIIRDGQEHRLAESVRLALKHGDGALRAVFLTPESRASANGSGTGATTMENGWEERVFSTRFACPDCRANLAEIEPRTFSFNSPYGACPQCDGLGAREGFDTSLIIPDWSLSLADGAVAPWRNESTEIREQLRQRLRPLFQSINITWTTPLAELSAADRTRLLEGDGDHAPGVIAHLEMDYAAAKRAEAKQRLAEFRGAIPCTACNGTRLRPEATACRLGGKGVHEIVAMSVCDAAGFFQQLTFTQQQQPIGLPLVNEICKRLAFLEQVGLHYLTLDRPADTLSGGELQRVRMATSIGSGLVGVMYVLDEPSIGLHPRDNARLIESLRDLQLQGNTVLVVEHDEELMRAADWLIDVGPGAGRLGGQIVAQGSPSQIERQPGSITADYLADRRRIDQPILRRRMAKSRCLELRGATLNNLKNIDVAIPLGLFTCVTGVSGSGKSSLVIDTLARALARKLNGAATRPGPYSSLRGASKLDRLVHVDQSPIGRTPRSNPATFTGIFDEVRRLFAETKHAKQLGYKLGRFSFNAKGGRCEQCQGQGVQRIEMKFLPDLFVTCPTCQGRQFNRQTLAVRFRDKSIADVLAMSIEQAAEFFVNHDAVHRMLTCLVDVGLGYLTLGQRSTTLSGGEAQRIKLAAELGRNSTGAALYVLDEPTTGLHINDVDRLLGVLQKLVDQGHTVLVIEHHLDLVKCADWVIDVGPEGGDAGGQIVATGAPDAIAECQTSFTGQWLKRVLQ